MKRHKGMLISLGILLAATFSASCQKPLHEETEQYILIATNINLEYWQEAGAGFLDAARGLHVKSDFQGASYFSPDEELKAFKEAVAKHPTGILVAPARPDLFNSAIDDAISAGIPVITMDTDAPNSKRILYIGTDNRQAGMESGRQIVKLMNGKGKLVVITIPGQLNLEERLRGAQEILAKSPDIKIVHTFDDRGDPRVANDQVSDMFKKDETVDGFLCLEASGGPGAAETLDRLNMAGKVSVVAMDMNPETLEYIDKKVVSVTIGQKPYTMAFYGLRFLDDLHHNVVHEFKDWRTAPASPLPTRVDTGTNVIDAGNLAAFRAAIASARNQ
ncbi:MAG TPA: substrate-binding domain-containing protein [Terriglobia bacterium]|nr:substrate-binding domain-containing protein [Terriglobia bacterium]